MNDAYNIVYYILITYYLVVLVMCNNIIIKLCINITLICNLNKNSSSCYLVESIELKFKE